MVAPVHNLDPTILPEGSAKPLWSSGKKKAHDVGGPSSSLKGSINFLESSSRGRPELDRFYMDRIISYKQQSCDVRAGAPRSSC